jgi:hypothetical protein
MNCFSSERREQMGQGSIQQTVNSIMSEKLFEALGLGTLCLVFALAAYRVAREFWFTARGEDTWLARLQRRHEREVNPRLLLRMWRYSPKWMGPRLNKRTQQVLAVACGAAAVYGLGIATSYAVLAVLCMVEWYGA